MVKNLLNENLQPRVLTIDDLSDYTGYAKSYLYRLSMQGKIPGCSKPGHGKLFFDRRIIDEWLLGNPVIKNENKPSTI